MSSLDHDRLLEKGPEARNGTGTRLGTRDQRPSGEHRPTTTAVPGQRSVPRGESVRTVDAVRELVSAEEARSLAAVQGAAADGAAVVVVKELQPAADACPRRWRWPRSRPLSAAGALVGALGLGAAFLVPAVQGEPGGSRSHSVSVAKELGISAQSARPVADERTTERLQELAASRAARETEQAAAARAQQEADRLAARPKGVLPVDGARLSSTFGRRWGTLHAGIDLAAPIGTPEHAAADGVVLEAGPARGFGLAVYIQHQNGDVTVYGHMEKILVHPGQVVRAGDPIALLGNRGHSTGPHLHLEVHAGGIDGPRIDPIPWLRDRGVAI